MEEKNNKLTYEQLEDYAKQLQNRVAMVEASLTSINMIKIRLDYLFKVLDRKDSFRPEFVNKCALEVEELLNTEDTQNKVEE